MAFMLKDVTLLYVGQGVDVTRNYFLGSRLEPNPVLDKRGSNDHTPQPCEEDMHTNFGNRVLSHSFESLEQKFHDDILKLSTEQNDAEDAENARHREKINAINEQYQEQLAALRARHASRRAEFLHKESHARQIKYQKMTMDHQSNSGRIPGDHHGYSGVAASVGVNEARQNYNTGHFESPREHSQFLTGARNRGFESRGPYPGARMYDSGSRYY
uniref:Uncharacterized protein MANES_11G103700 n=1 Tax=Rhizophora mucronata TaxID=61149 RepID=A0A2P2KMU6_RHIMU